MTPKQYEDYIGTLFMQKGYNVNVSPLSNDWGLDVVAIKDDEKIGIQAKMYGKSSRSVNRRVIMELYGASAYQDCTRTILATDGDILPDAIKVADKLGIEILRTSSDNDHDELCNTPRFSDSHKDGGMRKNRYLCGKEENQNGKTIEIHSSFQGQGRRGSPQGNRTAGDAGQKVWRGTLENHGMEERAA